MVGVLAVAGCCALLVTFGISISSMPLSNFAFTSSAFASRGSRMARVTVP